MSLPETQEELDAIINRALAPKLSRISELEGQVGTLTSERDDALNTVTTANERVSQLESDVEASNHRLLVKEVAHKKGVRERWLSGDTEEELTASADEYLADAKATLGVQGTGSNGQGGAPGDGAGSDQNPGSGVVPSSGTGDELPVKPSYKERLKEAYEKAQQEGSKGVTI